MHKQYIVFSQDQQDGYASISKHSDYTSAVAMAKRKAQQFPDSVFLVAETVVAAVCPQPEVILYAMKEQA